MFCALKSQNSQNHVLVLKTCQKGGKNDTFPGRVGDFEDGTDKVMTWTGAEGTAELLGLFAGVACVPCIFTRRAC